VNTRSGLRHERQQQRVFARREFDQEVAALHVTAVEVDRQIGVGHDARRFKPRAAQRGMQTCDEFGHFRNGFGM